MEYLQELTLDINTNTAYSTIGAKQGDNRSRVILIHLTNEGEDVEIASGAQAYFRFKKPDGKVVVNTASIVDNAIRVVLTSQNLAVAGRGYGDIVLQDGEGNISTVSFILIIICVSSKS